MIAVLITACRRERILRHLRANPLADHLLQIGSSNAHQAPNPEPLRGQKMRSAQQESHLDPDGASRDFDANVREKEHPRGSVAPSRKDWSSLMLNLTQDNGRAEALFPT